MFYLDSKSKFATTAYKLEMPIDKRTSEKIHIYMLITLAEYNNFSSNPDGSYSILSEGIFCRFFRENNKFTHDSTAAVQWRFRDGYEENEYYYKGHKIEADNDEHYQKLLKLKAFW